MCEKKKFLGEDIEYEYKPCCIRMFQQTGRGRIGSTRGSEAYGVCIPYGRGG
jgi:hypothetical protein